MPMGVCSPRISHLLPKVNKSLTANNKKQLLVVVSSSSKPQLTIHRRRLLLLSLPITITISIQLSRCSGSGSAAAAPVFDPVSDAERAASSQVSRRVAQAVELLEKGRESQAHGDYVQALHYFTQALEVAQSWLGAAITGSRPKAYAFTKDGSFTCCFMYRNVLKLLVVREYKDFALSEYARVGRALALYEVGDKNEAIAEMEDVSISLKGSPEVHAALAAALYSDKHASVLAENQFTIATLLDPKYTDLAYVKDTKHWPPSLVRSLQDFITLS